MASKKGLIWAGAVIVILIGLFFFFQRSESASAYDDFAVCLSQNNVIMYGTDWCPHCANQKKMFGKSFRYVDYRNCDLTQECQEVGVTGYPTWSVEGELYPGVQQLDRLAALSGCTL